MKSELSKVAKFFKIFADHWSSPVDGDYTIWIDGDCIDLIKLADEYRIIITKLALITTPDREFKILRGWTLISWEVFRDHKGIKYKLYRAYEFDKNLSLTRSFLLEKTILDIPDSATASDIIELIFSYL